MVGRRVRKAATIKPNSGGFSIKLIISAETIMVSDNSFRPGNIFSVENGKETNIPRVFISPSRYIQGPEVLKYMGRYLEILPSTRPLILISESGRERFQHAIETSLDENNLIGSFITFGGECSFEEINRIIQEAKVKGQSETDSIVAVGGGKCVDAGKSVAHRLGLPSVIFPSLASNDAPCSALSVLYSSDGISQGAEYFPDSPAIVAVDTKIVADAPVRFLVSGMGDAMATWYEAKTCFNNPQARTTVGARPTIAAGAIGHLCAETLYEYGVASISSAESGIIDDPLERVVESNTLLSGLGFESGGLAGAHSVAQAFTVIPEVQENYLHGEMVAFGLLTQLIFEGQTHEAIRAGSFFAQVGLPVNLAQLGVDNSDLDSLNKIMEAARQAPTMGNEPMRLSTANLVEAAIEVDDMGTDLVNTIGNSAYSKLH